MKIKLSKLASFKLELLLEYLEDNWSLSSKNKFLEHLKSTLNVIKQNPHAFPKSDFQLGLHRAIVTKQTALLYKPMKDTIFIITIFDTRQNRKKVTKEIKKHFG